MATIGLKIKDTTYDRMRWLKTRFEFVYEKSMSWDEFFEKISRDAIMILAYDLKERNKGKVSMDDIISILHGSSEGDETDLKDDFATVAESLKKRNHKGSEAI